MAKNQRIMVIVHPEDYQIIQDLLIAEKLKGNKPSVADVIHTLVATAKEDPRIAGTLQRIADFRKTASEPVQPADAETKETNQPVPPEESDEQAQ